MIKYAVLPFIFTISVLYGIAQQPKDSIGAASLLYSNGFFDDVNKNAISLQNNIEKKSLGILQYLQKHENKLKRKLAVKDSAAAAELFPSGTDVPGQLSSALNKTPETVYGRLADKLKHPPAEQALKEYIPRFDSLKTSLKFLHQNSLTSKLPAGYTEKITKATASVQALEAKMQQADNIKSYIKERREILKSELEKFGMVKDLRKMNEKAYYYTQQLQEYKAMLKDPKKAEEKALAVLRTLPAFQQFMQKNSMLASLFRLPDNYGTAESLAGLQTRASVQAQLQQRFGAAAISAPSGGGGGSYIQQQVQQAQGELTKLKDKIRAAGGGSSELEMPDFTPNKQKTKTFLQRIEYGANVQSQKTNAWLPVTSDLALTAGYKINDKSTIGIGASYKLGWGNGWKHIKLTHEGIGLRSYIDWKLKPIFGKIEGFWITGGYEQNLTPGPSPTSWRGGKEWQTSGLIGISKKYKIGKKTNNLQVLWDFLSYRQVPARQAVVFRVGYVF